MIHTDDYVNRASFDAVGMEALALLIVERLSLDFSSQDDKFRLVEVYEEAVAKLVSCRNICRLIH